MTALWVPLLLLASAGAAQAPPSMAVAAAASGRPPECRLDVASSKGPSVWAIAREPALRPYCDLVAKAHTLLATDPTGSEKAAEDAEIVLPGHAAPALVRARAALALGRLDDAERHFAEAVKLDPRGIEDPATLHDYARVLRRKGRVTEALASYRRLVPRAPLLANPDREVAVLLEAAHVAMAAPPAPAAPEADATSSVAGLEEAAAYLREARARPATQYKGDVAWSLSLVVDRTGQKENADALVAEARRSGARLVPSGIDYVVSEGDRDALAALAKEGDDPAVAAAQWAAFLAGPGGKGPWAKAANRRLEALRKAPRGGP